MSHSIKELARIFKEMGIMYEYLDGKNHFRALAYHRAYRIMQNFQGDISQLSEQELEEIHGIGHSIATKIEEYLATGTINKYEELIRQIPRDFIELLDIKGFGVETLKTINKKLGINTRKELLEALQDGRILQLKGFGTKKVENMLKGMQVFQKYGDRILLWDALEIAHTLETSLKKVAEIKKLVIAGSLRRYKETIGDIDILATADDRDREKVMEYFVNLDGISEKLVQGKSKSSIIIEDNHRQVDLRIVNPEEWGAALMYFTGSKEHNVHLRELAKHRGWKLSEYGLYNAKSDQKIAGSTEAEIYNAFGMQWIPPEMRENRGEFALAQKNRIPELVELKDIQGDLHLHSNWTDGSNTIEELCAYIRENFDYKYIGFTDHSKAVRVAGGLKDHQFLKQIKAIDKINKELGINFIKKGVEVDINLDGSLDLSEEVLEQLDWVIASIHTQQNRNNTHRLIKACQNPYVHVIGHPTGRLIGIREPYELDFDQLIQTALETGTALEINAQPERMDLNDRMAGMAREAGVKLLISTDTHAFANLDYMVMGVGIARRAWCRAEDILNTYSWEEIQDYFSRKKKRIFV